MKNLRKSECWPIKGRAMNKNHIFAKGLDKNELFYYTGCHKYVSIEPSF